MQPHGVRIGPGGPASACGTNSVLRCGEQDELWFDDITIGTQPIGCVG